jgi:uncharacterized heparinase superfamily protein
VYSADYEARNAFRSTAYHNTPKVDGEEINRFRGPADLFWLHDDARPQIRNFDAGSSNASLVAAHSGYERLAEPVTVVRRITLHHESHELVVEDRFEGSGSHSVEIPLHLPVHVQAVGQSPEVVLHANDRRFALSASCSTAWTFGVQRSRLSPSYGIVSPSTKLVWQHRGRLNSLTFRIAPS